MRLKEYFPHKLKSLWIAHLMVAWTLKRKLCFLAQWTENQKTTKSWWIEVNGLRRISAKIVPFKTDIANVLRLCMMCRTSLLNSTVLANTCSEHTTGSMRRESYCAKSVWVFKRMFYFSFAVFKMQPQLIKDLLCSSVSEFSVRCGFLQEF